MGGQGAIGRFERLQRRQNLLDRKPIRPEHLGLAEAAPEAAARAVGSPSEVPLLRSDVATFERTRILEALERAGGNQTRAAQLLGVSRRTLVSRLTSYGLTSRGKGH